MSESFDAIKIMKNPISKVDAESKITQAIITFEREYMGRGPENARTKISDDMVFIRLYGVLTPAEKQLGKSESNPKGRSLIKEVRQELIEQARPLLEAIILDVLGCGVISLHTDISTKTGERIIFFTLERVLIFK